MSCTVAVVGMCLILARIHTPKMNTPISISTAMIMVMFDVSNMALMALLFGSSGAGGPDVDAAVFVCIALMQTRYT